MWTIKAPIVEDVAVRTNFPGDEEEAIDEEQEELELKDKGGGKTQEADSRDMKKKAIKESLKAKGIGSHGQQTNDKLRNLKKRQRGLLMKLNQEREHLNAMSKQLLSQSQERIQELTSQYNHLRAQLDTKAILKVIDDSFRFHDDVTDSDVTTVTSETPQPGVLDMKLPSNV
ncbi:centrosome-associated protein 350-like [Diaphorina citri]|uniref:Centrosome-associated protein 350-like n=1 Tax=Diaphorina citri TaxID=121845 RepID=A0A3Q0JAY5_DIACI|nr:centrosome-associated protein 350-like [Diaphorina citri]